MRLLKQITAGILVTWGAIFAIAGVSVIFGDDEDRVSAFWGCMMLGAPPLVWGTLIYRNLDKQPKLNAQASTPSLTSTEVQDTFFRLLELNGGEVTLMRFVMETRLPAAEAREFLDDAAGQFNASFRVGDRGEIYYQFPIGEGIVRRSLRRPPTPPHPPNA